MHRLSAWLTTVILLLPVVAMSFGSDDAGTSAGVLLGQPSSARLLAMGGAGTAAGQGAEAMGWNPANLTEVSTFNTQFSFRRHFMDTELGYITAALPTPLGVPALAFTYARSANITAYDTSGMTTGTFATQEMDLQLGWAVSWDKWHLGLAGHYFYQDLNVAQIHGGGADVGAGYDLFPWLKAGLSVLRLGKTEHGDPFATEIRGGLAASLLSKLTLSADIAFPRDSNYYFATGAEWTLFHILSLRAGWSNGPADKSQWTDLGWLSAGVGLKWQDFTLDYLYAPAGFVEDVHHITLGYHYQFHPPAVKTETSIPKEMSSSQEPRQWTPRSLAVNAGQAGGTQMQFTPRALGHEYQVREMTFTITGPDGRTLKTYHFIKQDNVPRTIAWDGLDEQGRPTGGPYALQVNYLTNRGPVTYTQQWPAFSVTGKLQFLKDGDGLAPEAIIHAQGPVDQIKTWTLTIYKQDEATPIRTMSAPGRLPEDQTWDGMTDDQQWADPAITYHLMLHLIDKNGAQMAVEKNLPPIPAQELGRMEQTAKFKLLEIKFPFRSNKITPAILPQLDKAVEIYKHYQSKITALRIEGHADEQGSDRVNNNVSRRRSLEVRYYMYHHGVPPSFPIQVKWFGKKHPFSKAGTKEGHAKNRRVEIVFEIKN